MLALQLIIKQWDKSERTAAHILQRANSPNCFAIKFPPAFYFMNKAILIDQHDGNLRHKEIKAEQLTCGKIKLDRFELDVENSKLGYFDKLNPDNTAKILGSLNKQWIQCKYSHRYSVFEGDFYYWLYEEVTLNAIYIDEFNEHTFINNQPTLIFKDLKDS